MSINARPLRDATTDGASLLGALGVDPRLVFGGLEATDKEPRVLKQLQDRFSRSSGLSNASLKSLIDRGAVKRDGVIKKPDVASCPCPDNYAAPRLALLIDRQPADRALENDRTGAGAASAMFLEEGDRPLKPSARRTFALVDGEPSKRAPNTPVWVAPKPLFARTGVIAQTQASRAGEATEPELRALFDSSGADVSPFASRTGSEARGLVRFLRNPAQRQQLERALGGWILSKDAGAGQLTVVPFTSADPTTPGRQPSSAVTLLAMLGDLRRSGLTLLRYEGLGQVTGFQSLLLSGLANMLRANSVASGSARVFAASSQPGAPQRAAGRRGFAPVNGAAARVDAESWTVPSDERADGAVASAFTIDYSGLGDPNGVPGVGATTDLGGIGSLGPMGPMGPLGSLGSLESVGGLDSMGSYGYGAIGSSDSVSAVLADPSLTVEDKVTLMIMLIMKKMDQDIERQAQYINSLQQQQSAGGGASSGAPSIDVETMKLKRLIDKRGQMFDMLRQIIDKYNQTAKGIIDSMGRQ